MKTLFNTISRIAVVLTIMLSCHAIANADTMTITLVDGTVITYDLSASATDSVQYVGGAYGTNDFVGVKIYLHGGNGASDDYVNSQIRSLVVTTVEVPAAPVISPNGGYIYAATTVTITTTTSDATIYYTTDGTTPSTSSTRYTAAFTVSTTTSVTVKAIAVKNGQTSEVTTAVFTYTNDNNLNANWKSGNWTKNNGSMSYTPQTAGFYRLEVPHISDETNTSWVQKSTSSYGVTFAIEWSNTLKANRWTCYQFHAGNRSGNQTASDSFKEDTELPSGTRSTLANYSNSGYSRGHLCPKADRKMSTEQYGQTFYLSNMQPQWQSHNGGQWNNLEGDVRTWATKCDTLYVVKAATIDDVTLNGTTESGIFSTTYNGTTYSDLKCNGVLPVPKYFYMALLAYDKSNNKYYAMGIWTKHYNTNDSGDWPKITQESAQYITIDELEARTGIDFFCNLPDDIEAQVEATLNTTWWSNGVSLNR